MLIREQPQQTSWVWRTEDTSFTIYHQHSGSALAVTGAYTCLSHRTVGFTTLPRNRSTLDISS